VIGGMQLVSSPYVPHCISRRIFGKWSIHLSNTSEGSAQSSPITATLSIVLMV